MLEAFKVLYNGIIDFYYWCVFDLFVSFSLFDVTLILFSSFCAYRFILMPMFGGNIPNLGSDMAMPHAPKQKMLEDKRSL